MDAARESYHRVSSALLRGDPVGQLVAYAAGNGVDLIAMATRARWDDPGVSSESVADAVARLAPVPVLLRRVPLRAGEVAPFPGPLRVVVPLDGSRLAERALPLAAELAGASGGSLLLVQVIDDQGAFAAYRAGQRELALAELRAAHDYLASVQARCRARGLPVEATVRVGSPSETITWVALDLGADLVAMATHGRSGARRERLGSVALALLRTGLAPLLLVPGAAPAPDVGGVAGLR